jgi:DNA polymerase-4
VVGRGIAHLTICLAPLALYLGVGPVTANKMNQLGIFTGADLRRQSLPFLQQHLGKAGPWYHAIANGEDDRPVVPDRPRRSSGSETTFSNDLTDSADIEAGVQAMADEVWAWCEKARAFGRTVTVKIKYADFQQATRSRTLPAIVTSKRNLARRQHRPRADGVPPRQRYPAGRRDPFEL